MTTSKGTHVKNEKGYVATELAGLAVFAVLVAAWITHVVVCLKTAAWGFLIAGAILFPIGIIHGVGLWFGWF
jgi:hypothetical protein